MALKQRFGLRIPIRIKVSFARVRIFFLFNDITIILTYFILNLKASVPHLYFVFFMRNFCRYLSMCEIFDQCRRRDI